MDRHRNPMPGSPGHLVLSNPPKPTSSTPRPLRTPPPPPPIPVKIPCIWCAAASAIYLKINYFNGGEPGNGISPSVIKMLSDTIDQLDAHIAKHGDGVIPHGAFDHQAMGFSWYSVNVNNHQQTWGVVAHAVNALLTFMLNYQSFGMAQFLIFDGENQVGTGTLGPSFSRG
ncbi:MAG: hypothetical protein FRX48_02136 [Lasallia pustulata]|uniref:Uncharacterized protein n=1 Tax=Lasallia pustulata TaxID=136370 RepID=A0A5M8PVU3_9LECA|nr:MAG: hypothetical protein FRX48_02136 [Lasallia pustulata]